MKTILIVDDEAAARYGMRRALESKYRVAEADSAAAAKEALSRERPDLVLLDVVMPDGDGPPPQVPDFILWAMACRFCAGCVSREVNCRF